LTANLSTIENISAGGSILDVYQMPSDKNTENAILGAILLNYTQCVSFFSQIKEKYFSSEVNRIIFREMLFLHESGISIDVLSLSDGLKKHKKLEEIGGSYYLTTLMEAVPSAANLQYHIDIIKEKYFLREHIKIAEQIKEKALRLESSKEILAFVANSLLLSEENREVQTKIVSSGDIVKKRKEDLIERVSGTLVGTGYKSIDRYLAQGFSPDHSSVIFGRTRHGKSALKANLTVNQCRKGYSVAHITPEQGFSVEMDRLTSIISGIPLIEMLKIREWAKVENNQIISDRTETLARIREAAKEINSWNIHFHSGTVSLAEIKRFVVETKMRYGLDIVYIDLFDRIEEVSSAISNKPQVVTKAIGFLENIAVTEHVHMNYVVQSSRGAESRVDRKPQLIDLKESGSFEERTWLVFSVYREHLLKKEVPDDTIEISINKQKNGPEATIELLWNPETLTISEEIF